MHLCAYDCILASVQVEGEREGERRNEGRGGGEREREILIWDIVQ